MKKNFVQLGKLCALSLCLLWLVPHSVGAQSVSTIWVGETKTLDETAGFAYTNVTDVSWTTTGGYFSMSGTQLYRKVTATQYWSGVAYVNLSFRYTYYYGDTQKKINKSYGFKVQANPVSLSRSSMTVGIGETEKLNYSHYYSNKYTSYAKVTYSSSNSNVARVDNNGNVYGVKEGTAVITCYSNLDNPLNAPTCTVTVKDVTPTGVSLPTTATVVEGETATIKATLIPADAKSPLTWSSDDTSIATVSSTGVIKGIKKGTTTIRVVTQKGNFKASCKLTVTPAPTEVKIPAILNLFTGFGRRLTPTLVPSDASSTYTWSTSATKVATVNSQGLVTGVSPGEAVIIVKTKNGKTAKCTATVENHEDNARLLNSLNTINNLMNTTFDFIYY